MTQGGTMVWARVTDRADSNGAEAAHRLLAVPMLRIAAELQVLEGLRQRIQRAHAGGSWARAAPGASWLLLLLTSTGRCISWCGLALQLLLHLRQGEPSKASVSCATCETCACSARPAAEHMPT